MDASPDTPLENPVWSAVTTTQALLGVRRGSAARYDPDVAPFAAVADGSDRALLDLGEIMAPQDQVFVLAAQPLCWPRHLQADRLFDVRQMVDAGRPGAVVQDGVVQLSAADASLMLDLTRKTQPGPFGTRTHEMGNYIGIRSGDRLVAMAGERMRWTGFTEISAVCVDEELRGQGIAARLMNILRHAIRQRGEVPFLHVRSDNATAIGLYERLGFDTRRQFGLYRITARSAQRQQ